MTNQRATFRSNIIEYPEAYARATRVRIIENAKKTWRKNTPNHEEIESILNLGRGVVEHGRQLYSNNFYGKIAQVFDNYGKISEKQAEALLNAYNKRQEKIEQFKKAVEEQKAHSQFMGVVAEKRECVLTVEKVFTVDCPSFSYYDRSSQEVYLMRDEEGNRIVLKTKSDINVNNRPLTEKDAIKAKFTIKAHNEYKGEKQTIIQRMKVIELLKEAE